MSARALRHLEDFLERKHPGFADDPALHAEARALSEAYTTGQPFSPHAAGRVAYLAHFGPRAVVAVSHALASTEVPPICVDVGAGSGASSLALLLPASGHAARRVTLVEQSASALQMARELLEGLGDVRVHQGDLHGAPPAAEADLLLSAFTFGELAGSPFDAWRTLERLAPRAGLAAIVDAGDRPRARRLQELRDSLRDGGERGLRVIAPCPHDDICPALLRARDWCHARLPKELPDRLARFARAVGRDDEQMAASFLLLADAHRSPRTNSSHVVVIGEALREKGRVRLPVCGPGGLRFVQALKRHRPVHDAVLELPRGAHLPSALAENIHDHTAHVEEERALRDDT